MNKSNRLKIKTAKHKAREKSTVYETVLIFRSDTENIVLERQSGAKLCLSFNQFATVNIFIAESV